MLRYVHVEIYFKVKFIYLKREVDGARHTEINFVPILHFHSCISITFQFPILLFTKVYIFFKGLF